MTIAERTIDTITVFVAVSEDPDGVMAEGIMAAYIGGQWMPLIASDPVRLEALRPLAVEVARDTGLSYVERTFVRAEDELTAEAQRLGLYDG